MEGFSGPNDMFTTDNRDLSLAFNEYCARMNELETAYQCEKEKELQRLYKIIDIAIYMTDCFKEVTNKYNSKDNKVLKEILYNNKMKWKVIKEKIENLENDSNNSNDEIKCQLE